MLRVYRREDGRLVSTDLEVTTHSSSADAAGALWLDLINPTREEENFAEHLLGISIPTREEAQEIEVSARLYHEDDAEFMTMTGVSQLESDAPMTTPISFILKGETLVTIRYAQPKPFFTYATRAQKTGRVPCIDSEQIMLGLVEALDRAHGRGAGEDRPQPGASVAPGFPLQAAGTAKRARAATSRRSSRRSAPGAILLAMIRESLVSLNRLLAYHNTTGKGGRRAQQGRGRLGQGHAAGHCRAQRPRDLSLEQDQLPARCDARPDQSRAEPDHQDFLHRRGLPDAADCWSRPRTE